MKKPNHYVNNEEFFQAIVEHRKKLDLAKSLGLEEPRISDYLGMCIYKIADRLSTRPCFVNYSFRDEMISDGVENCISCFNNFDPNYIRNPFAYFTQVIYFAFLRKIEEEEKARYSKYKSFQRVGSDPNLLVDDDGISILTIQNYDNINEFIDRFEKKMEIKKQKRKELKRKKDADTANTCSNKVDC